MAVLHDLRLSLLVATLVAGASAGALALSGRAPHLPPDALQAAIQAELPERVHTVLPSPGGEAPWGPGDPVQIWLTAGDPANLFQVSARQIGEATSLLSPPRRLRATPLAAEEIVLARADQALVALRDGAAVRVIALQGATPMALYLAEPTEALRGAWTADGFSLETDAGPITVDTTRGAVAPPTAGQWLTFEAASTEPEMSGVGDAGRRDAHAWTSGETITRDGVQLTAFDSRAVALRYLPGVVHPGGIHGRPGDGERPTETLAWLTPHGPGGAAVDGALLAPMIRGGAAIAIDSAGRARVGAYAGEPTTPRDGTLRQVGPPLVLDGRPVRTGRDVPEARRGVGVTDAGWIIVAESKAATHFALGSALASAAVTQAVSLDLTAEDPPSAAHDVFAIVPRVGLRAPRWQAAGWTAKDAGLAIRQHAGVELALIETTRARIHIIAGSDEIGGADQPAPDDGWCLTGGVRSDRAPYGLKLGADTRRAPREGVLGLMIDAAGNAKMGLAPAQTADDVSVLQGPQLVREGRAAIEDRRVEPGVLTAIGARADGRLIYAQTSDDIGALVEALLAHGVIDAIRLGDVSAPDAGRVVPATALGASEGTALHLTPAPPPPGVLPAKAIRAW